MKALQVTVSGSYKTSNDQIVDFEDIKGFIPFVDDEHAKMHVRSRYASEWVREAKKPNGDLVFPKRIDMMRQVFIDDMKECEHDFSFVGKDIKKMTYEELQDLATAKDLRTIPLPKKISGADLRDMRTKAYLDYSKSVVGVVIDVNEPLPQYAVETNGRLTFDFAKVPPLVVEGSEPRVDATKKLSNEDVLDQEQKPMRDDETPKTSLSLEELKKIADQKGISYHWKIGKEKLYDQIFGGANV